MPRSAIWLSLCALTACTVGPDYLAPRPHMPAQWSTAKAAQDAEEPSSPQALAEWWTQFNDPVLTALVEEGLRANADVALAAARVSEARAALDLADAQRYPTIGLSGDAARQKQSSETFNARLSGAKPFNTYNISAVLGYELDLWGRIRRASEAAQARLLAQQANRDAVALAVASDIATGYFNLLALREQERITERTIITRRESLTYQGKQYRAGAVDVLTFKRAEAELAAAEAVLPDLQQQVVQQQNALGILLGRSPQEIIVHIPPYTQRLTALPVPPILPADAPASLLQRRPDIAVAEQQLIAANAEIGVARAQYYPNFSLSALVGLGSLEIDRLLRSSAEAWSIGASTAMPLLDFGRTRANVEGAEARKAQAVITYQQTVRLAVADVANSLSAQQTSAAREKALRVQVQANAETQRVAQLRFNAGYATQLDLLDAQRQLYAAQLEATRARQQQLAAAVTLYKALGGGWRSTPEAEATPRSAAKPTEVMPKKAVPKDDASKAASPTLPATLPFKKARP